MAVAFEKRTQKRRGVCFDYAPHLGFWTNRIFGTHKPHTFQCGRSRFVQKILRIVQIQGDEQKADALLCFGLILARLLLSYRQYLLWFCVCKYRQKFL